MGEKICIGYGYLPDHAKKLMVIFSSNARIDASALMITETERVSVCGAHKFFCEKKYFSTFLRILNTINVKRTVFCPKRQ